MASVTRRIKAVKQPRGGYLKLSSFEVVNMFDGVTLYFEENVSPVIVGLAVDYLSRFNMGSTLTDAFHISLLGVNAAKKLGIKNADKIADMLMSHITGLDDESVIYACKMVSFDVWFRSPKSAVVSTSFTEINPDPATILNIQTMVKRTMTLFEKYGPVVKDGFNFSPAHSDTKAFNDFFFSHKGSYGGYTPTVHAGDGDFLTKDTLWDIKVSTSKPTSSHTLQLLMYWIMGQHSGQEVFKSITKVGLFNPRLNEAYILDMNTVPDIVIKEVEREVICY